MAGQEKYHEIAKKKLAASKAKLREAQRANQRALQVERSEYVVYVLGVVARLIQIVLFAMLGLFKLTATVSRLEGILNDLDSSRTNPEGHQQGIEQLRGASSVSSTSTTMAPSEQEDADTEVVSATHGVGNAVAVKQEDQDQDGVEIKVKVEE